MKPPVNQIPTRVYNLIYATSCVLDVQPGLLSIYDFDQL